MSKSDVVPQALGCDAPSSQMLSEQFVLALLSTARAWRNALDARLKALGVGVGQAGWLAIAMLARSGLALSQHALADRLAIGAPSMGATIDRLSELGLVARIACPGDRRIKLVGLTDAGRDLHRQVRMEAEAFRSGILAGIDPARLESLATLLETVIERIGADQNVCSTSDRQPGWERPAAGSKAAIDCSYRP